MIRFCKSSCVLVSMRMLSHVWCLSLNIQAFLCVVCARQFLLIQKANSKGLNKWKDFDTLRFRTWFENIFIFYSDLTVTFILHSRNFMYIKQIICILHWSKCTHHSSHAILLFAQKPYWIPMIFGWQYLQPMCMQALNPLSKAKLSDKLGFKI